MRIDVHSEIDNKDCWVDGCFHICELENEVVQSYFHANESNAERSQAQSLVPEQIPEYRSPLTQCLEFQVQDANALGHQNFALLKGRWTTEMALYVRSHPLMQGLGQTVLTATKHPNQRQWW